MLRDATAGFVFGCQGQMETVKLKLSYLCVKIVRGRTGWFIAWGQESWGSISEVKHLKGEGAKWCKWSVVMVTAVRVINPKTGLILSHMFFKSG